MTHGLASFLPLTSPRFLALQVLSRYRRFSAPVVFSADAVFFSRHANAEAYALAYPTSPTLYRFLNSGSVIGE